LLPSVSFRAGFDKAAPKIAVDSERVAEFCGQYHIQRLRLFGSVLRDDFHPGSDVDILVEFEPGHTLGWEIVGIEDELGRILGGRKVDRVNPRFLNARLRNRILHEAVVTDEQG
jgi:predicted nucleotidyltransferase